MGIEQSTQQSIYTPSAPQIVLLCVHAPRGLFRVPFLHHPPPLSDGNLYPAALLCMRGNHLRPYLSILAFAIEVQHNNENPTTIFAIAFMLQTEEQRKDRAEKQRKLDTVSV